MAQKAVVAQANPHEPPVSAGSSATMACPDFSPRAEAPTFWAGKVATPAPGATVSAMWATSVLWAAENLAGLISGTIRNVTRSNSIPAGRYSAFPSERRPLSRDRR